MANVSNRHVPHEGPEDADIFFLGEAPGRDEDVAQRPFQGASGNLLNFALEEMGIDRSRCRVGNVLNYQPAGNKFHHAKGSWQLAESREYLTQYLKTHKHKILVPLGGTALEFLTGYKEIEKRRGSVYFYAGNTPVLGTIHPAAVLRDGSHTPAFLHDLGKVLRILKDGYNKPSFNFVIDPDPFQLQGLLPTLLSAPRLYVDIETRRKTGDLRCIGFAWSERDAVVIFPENFNVLRQLLESPVPKTFHNGYFDTMLLRHHGYEVANWDFDTMIAQYCLQPELPLGLDYITSLYTDINYYKDDGKDSTDKSLPREKLGRYNALDCVATAQCETVIRSEMDDHALVQFKYRFSMVEMAQHFATSGMYVHSENREKLRTRVEEKRDKDYQSLVLLCTMNDHPAFMVTQHAKVAEFLYTCLKLPTKTNREGGVTTDDDALVSLMATCQMEIQNSKSDKRRTEWKYKLAAVKLVRNIRGYDKLLSSYINIDISPDGRVRSNYNITGTETGRWSSSKFWDDTGLNGQTIPREGI